MKPITESKTLIQLNHTVYGFVLIYKDIEAFETELPIFASGLNIAVSGVELLSSLVC